MKKVMKYIHLLFLCFYALSSQAQVSPKRGLAYGNNSQADINVLKPGISWWYNWSDTPDPLVKDIYANLGVEFVPMAWNGNITAADFIAKVKPGAKYLLAFNEPNLKVEANMTPEQAVAAWPKIEQIAAAKNLEIVSAAAIYAGTGATGGYTDPVKWHQQFFKLCPTCKVDYIAFHTYEANPGGAIALTQNLTQFNRPVWITEFADYSATTDAEEKAYLQEVVTSFENNPDVFRYSWFTGRRSDAPRINILGTSGVLTDLGKAYIGASYTSKKINMPGRIVANKHYRRKGTGLENTTDGGTVQNVCYIDAGDWAEYMLNVTTAGAHTLKFRVASAATAGKFDIQVNGVTVKTDVTFAATGGWQTWVDVPVTGVNLPQGEVYLKIIYKTKEFNFNYIDVTYESGLKASPDFSASKISTCSGNSIVFTDLTTYKVGGETYAWNFGSGATPATATGAGPHTVSYSTGGIKSPQLTVTNTNGTNSITKTNYITISAPSTDCLFSDDFTDNTVKWLSVGPFTYAESGTATTVSNAGYGEWENFTYKLNNGTQESPLNFACSSNKPLLKVKAKASVAGKCVLTATLIDANGRAIDNVSAVNFELTTAYQVFQVNFAGKFKNIYSPTNSGNVDSTNIVGIQFSINPGYASAYPVVGASSIKYNAMYTGTLDIDWVSVGNNCNPILTGVNNLNADAVVYELYPNPFNNEMTISSSSDGSVTVFDLSGREVINSSLKVGANIFSTDHLAQGVYVVQVKTNNGVSTQKLVKQ